VSASQVTPWPHDLASASIAVDALRRMVSGCADVELVLAPWARARV